MINKININHVVVSIAVSILLVTSLTGTADQPQSTVTAASPPTPESGDLFVPYQGDTDLIVSTSQVPTPSCPDDTPDGDPTYYWDFGSDLNGTDNDDGTYDGTPDTATISASAAGTYNVTVYCTENFTPSGGSTSDDYPNSTTPDTTP